MSRRILRLTGSKRPFINYRILGSQSKIKKVHIFCNILQ